MEIIFVALSEKSDECHSPERGRHREGPPGNPVDSSLPLYQKFSVDLDQRSDHLLIGQLLPVQEDSQQLDRQQGSIR